MLFCLLTTDRCCLNNYLWFHMQMLHQRRCRQIRHRRYRHHRRLSHLLCPLQYLCHRYRAAVASCNAGDAGPSVHMKMHHQYLLLGPSYFHQVRQCRQRAPSHSTSTAPATHPIPPRRLHRLYRLRRRHRMQDAPPPPQCANIA